MSETLTHIVQQPGWASSLSSEVDTLEFGLGSECFTKSTKFLFGTTEMIRLEAVKTLFRKIGGNFHTAHRTLDFWQGKNCPIFRGEADLQKKGGYEAKIVDPYMWIFHVDKTWPEKFERIFIAGNPVQTDAII